MRLALVTCLVLASTFGSPSSSAAEPADNRDVVGRVLELTNAERQNAGLASLSLSPELEGAAQSYSDVLASSGCFDHTCGPVPNFADRDDQAGYTDWTDIGETSPLATPPQKRLWRAGWLRQATVPTFCRRGSLRLAWG